MKAIGLRLLLVAAAGAWVLGVSTGCASRQGTSAGDIPDPAVDPSSVGLVNPPTKVPLRTFTSTELKAVSLAPALERKRDADELARRLDRALHHDFERLLPKLEVVPRGVELTRTTESTLQIVPRVEEARLVSRLARTWLSWGAGDVQLVIRVAFVDGKTGEILAEPVFRRHGSAFWGSWSNGADDKEVEDLLTADVLQYARDNR